MKNVKILIATHKQYFVPKDNIYLPIHVGADSNKNKTTFIDDNTGENISNKNPYFCELTGLYWAWKNLKNDYIGLVHYRRYFSICKHIPKTPEKKFDVILNKEQVNNLLKDNDIILPKERKYYIENLYDHYKHTMYVKPLDETGRIIQEKYPEYMNEFNKLHKRTSAHMFNMFIMKKDILDEYCKWLFDILFELENRMKGQGEEYDKIHSRFYGRISELLLDVWINTNCMKYAEVKVIDMEKINWWKKGISFLKAKFFGIRNDVNNLIQAMDIFVFPSYFEGLSVTLIEAYASGIKIIASKEAINDKKMIFENVKRVSLKEDIVIWKKRIIDKINNVILYDREKESENNIENIKKIGFDIKEETKIFDTIIY